MTPETTEIVKGPQNFIYAEKEIKVFPLRKKEKNTLLTYLRKMKKIVDPNKFSAALTVLLLQKQYLSTNSVGGIYGISVLLSICIGCITYVSPYVPQMVLLLGIITDILLFEPAGFIPLSISLLIISLTYIKILGAHTELEQYISAIEVAVIFSLFLQINMVLEIVLQEYSKTLSVLDVYNRYRRVEFILKLYIAFLSTAVHTYMSNTLKLFRKSILLNTLNFLVTGVFIVLAYRAYEVLYTEYQEVIEQSKFIAQRIASDIQLAHPYKEAAACDWSIACTRGLHESRVCLSSWSF